MTTAKSANKGINTVECLVLGAPGVGKTTFALNLIEALGYHEVQIFHEDPSGRITSRMWPIAEAKERLVGEAGAIPPGGCTTRGLQWATVKAPGRAGRQGRHLTIVDSTGIGSEISDDLELRAAVAQTLRMLRRARMVIHLISPTDGGPGPVDEMLREFCAGLPQGRYLPLATKADLAGGKDRTRWARPAAVAGGMRASAVGRETTAGAGGMPAKAAGMPPKVAGMPPSAGGLPARVMPFGPALHPFPVSARRRRDLLALVKRLGRTLAAAEPG